MVQLKSITSCVHVDRQEGARRRATRRTHSPADERRTEVSRHGPVAQPQMGPSLSLPRVEEREADSDHKCGQRTNRQPNNSKQDGDLQASVPHLHPVRPREIWVPALTGRLRDQLTSPQRKAILALTGAYSTTNNLKLLDLIEIIEINAESACQLESRWKDNEEKKQIRTAHLARQRNHIEGERYVNLFADQLTSIRRKESFWLMSATGRSEHAPSNSTETSRRTADCVDWWTSRLSTFCTTAPTSQTTQKGTLHSIRPSSKRDAGSSSLNSTKPSHQNPFVNLHYGSRQMDESPVEAESNNKINLT